MPTLETCLKDHALGLGFDLVGITTAQAAETFGQFQVWLAHGYAGEMAYLHRHGQARAHPRSILPQVRSIVMVALNYHPGDQANEPPAAGRIARYARGRDYHDIVRGKLKQLLAWVQEQMPACSGRAVVDTAPLLERDFARRAGLGWFGKNTMLLNKKLGSYFFLGALLLDISLQPDQPFTTSHCGTCTACLDACPTHAFAAPGVLDARRCISYLTIELRGPIDPDLRPLMNDWLFGCDVCQEVCPWNRKAPLAREPAFIAAAERRSLQEIVQLTEEEFPKEYQGTALARPGHSGLARNAAIVLGNSGDRVLPSLENAQHGSDPVLQEAARWAKDRIVQRQEPDEK